MIEFLSTVFPWVFLNSVCALIGGMVLSDVRKTGMGVLIGIFLGPIGLFVVVLICQWEQTRKLESVTYVSIFDGGANQAVKRYEG